MPDPVDVERFRGDLIALSGAAPTQAAPLGLAVSGGPDSMAMLVLAAEAFPGAVLAATVDHKLRSDAHEEALMVAGEAARLGVPHIILCPDVPIRGSSIQARAREARYALFADWAASENLMAIATAHHADDQAETFLMRASRVSGVTGLAGIRPRVRIDGADYVRPLIGWRRAVLRAVVRRAGVAFVDDPSNSDLRHDRTRFRRLLLENEWLDPPALARTALAIGEAERDLAAIAELLWKERVKSTAAGVAFCPDDLPRDPLRRMVRRAIATVRAMHDIAAPPFDGSANVEALLDTLAAGRRGTHGGVSGSIRAGEWHFRPAPPRRSH